MAQRVRLTRRGRAVVLILCLLLSAAAAAAVGSASQAAGVAGEPQVAVVRSGDTLWSVAARHVPSRDPYGVIAEIRRLNDLTDSTIHPGQELILPAR
jgi:LysM repeat protein